MNPSLITSNLWRLRRKSTRSSGVHDKTQHISSFPQMVRIIIHRPLFIRSNRRADKTIKLWKVFEKSLRIVSENNLNDGQRPLPPPTSAAALRLPRLQQQDHIIAATPRKVYANAHAYHINSISINSDGETYISADDLRINLWNLGISNESFSSYRLKR